MVLPGLRQGSEVCVGYKETMQEGLGGWVVLQATTCQQDNSNCLEFLSFGESKNSILQNLQIQFCQIQTGILFVLSRQQQLFLMNHCIIWYLRHNKHDQTYKFQNVGFDCQRRLLVILGLRPAQNTMVWNIASLKVVFMSYLHYIAAFRQE